MFITYSELFQDNKSRLLHLVEDARGNFKQGNMSADSSSSAGLYPKQLDNINNVPFFFMYVAGHVACCIWDSTFFGMASILSQTLKI